MPGTGYSSPKLPVEVIRGTLYFVEELKPYHRQGSMVQGSIVFSYTVL